MVRVRVGVNLDPYPNPDPYQQTCGVLIRLIGMYALGCGEIMGWGLGSSSGRGYGENEGCAHDGKTKGAIARY